MSATPFADTLALLTRQRGVLGSMVVSEADGIIVDSNLQIGVKGNVVAALAAAIHASAGELGKQLDGKPFHVLHHAGKSRQIVIAPAQTKRGLYIFLTVFDQESSLGLVQLYFEEFAKRLADAAPAAEPTPVVLAENFERDLNRNLASLFGR